ncbi:hypothetical protein EDC53_109181 [Phytobacter diazotrophicus]|nr:hypothetical protein EDC53_109181 [Phytobacter diazotrophicus]
MLEGFVIVCIMHNGPASQIYISQNIMRLFLFMAVFGMVMIDVKFPIYPREMKFIGVKKLKEIKKEIYVISCILKIIIFGF